MTSVFRSDDCGAVIASPSRPPIWSRVGCTGQLLVAQLNLAVKYFPKAIRNFPHNGSIHTACRSTCVV